MATQKKTKRKRYVPTSETTGKPFLYKEHPMNAKFRRLPDGLRNGDYERLRKDIPRTDGHMKLNEYQIAAKEFVAFPDNFTITYPALGLASEAGEVCDKIKKCIRNRSTLELADLYHELLPELGDCLWYVAILAHNVGLELEDVATYNIEKLRDRKERDVIKSTGDHR